MKIYPIISIDEGQLAVMAAPPGGASLPGAIAGLRTLRIRKVVSLLEPDESQKLALHDESSECRSQGIVYENYPIADYQVPDSMEQFSKFNCTLVQGVQKGVNTVIHCRAGIGRSGLVA
ncbi:MAG: dual specificity protein phosphatase family protein, partial [Granulosicoccus sp.]|nr:dual specificity protein phosphatase family protein [Granulosicoccus sp.]